MGKWATYSRRGGGTPSVPAILQMIAAFKTGPFDTTLFYNGDVGAPAFGNTDFTSNPSGTIVDVFVVSPPDELFITWFADTTGDTSVTYSGNEPGFLTPQTILY